MLENVCLFTETFQLGSNFLFDRRLIISKFWRNSLNF